MTIHQLIEGAAFEPETTAIMGRAYEAAIRNLGPAPPPTVLETIAKRILDATQAGERNPETLTAVALRGLDGRG
jgi:hypothetical protein